MASPRDLVAETFTELAAVRGRWEALQASGAATPFQSFTFVSALDQTIGRAHLAETFVVIVRERNGRDLMLLPLVRRWVGPARIIELPDFGVSDYGAPVLAPEALSEPHSWSAIWKAALAVLPRADLIRINKIPEELGPGRNPMLSLPGLWLKDTHSWRVGLPERWPDYETSTLSSKFRVDLRRRLRKFEKAHEVTYFRAQDEAGAREIFDVLCAHREFRFARLGRPEILRIEAYRDFYWQLVRNGLASGLASLSALRAGSEIVATLLGLRWRDRYLVLIPTFTEGEDWKQYALGKLMNWFEMREMHGQGCRHYDFTIGDEPYKRDFSATPAHLYEIAVPLKIQASPLAWGLKLRAGFRRWQKPPLAA